MKKRIFLVMSYLLLGGLVLQPQGWAYSSEIDANYYDIWKAAKEILKPFGIKHENGKKGEIESRWIEDTIERSNKILPMRRSPSLTKTFKRRYRLKFSFEEYEGRIRVLVRGKFQEKPFDDRSQTQWKGVKPQPEDYDIERIYFFKVLRQLEIARQTTSANTP